jgi:hypothetical protein
VYPHQDAASWLVALSAADTISSAPIDAAEPFRLKDVPAESQRLAHEITEHLRRLAT